LWTESYANEEYDVFLTVDSKGRQAEIEEQSFGHVVIRIHDCDEWSCDAELGVSAVGDDQDEESQKTRPGPSPTDYNLD